jgi:phosphoadenosine phosphosulfate reductase
MAGTQGMLHEFERWPKFKQAYLRAFQRMIDSRRAKGLIDKTKWETPEEVFNWWVYRQPKDESIEGQIDIWEDE